MIESPLVSVIIPCYNSEKYVEQAVRSIMVQTYKNLEILITDDCSTDGSFAILQKLAKEDSRIKLFTNEHNQKIVRTLNALVERANGKYIARMDADDISLPKRIEKQVCFMEAHPDIAICGTNAWHINEKGKSIGKSTLPNKIDDCRFFLKYFSTLYHPTLLILAAVLKQNLYSEYFCYAEDYELWIRLAYQHGLKLMNLQEKLFLYRLSDTQSSFTHHEKQINSVAKIFTTYNLLEEKSLQTHLNIFFTFKSSNLADEKIYISKVLHEIKHTPFHLQRLVLEKIFLYMYTTKKFSLKVLFTPLIFVIVFKYFKTKLLNLIRRGI